MVDRAQKGCRMLRVQVGFERSRVATACLVDAYERVVPRTRRSSLSQRGRDVPAAPDGAGRARRAEGSR
jgi:hypothetical protein